LSWFEKKPRLAELTTPPSRDDLIRRARVALLDDETPEVMADVQAHGFAVDHLRSTSDARFSRLAGGVYDLLLLDYGGIGLQYGADEGLDVLRHLRRVNPALVVIAFSGRTFDASKSDFFRLCHAVLKKDAGIRETLEILELHLGKALTPNHQWAALLNVLQLPIDSKEAVALEKKIRQSAGTPRQAEVIKTAIGRFGPIAGAALAEQLASKALEYGLKYLVG
jgi:DNA-binding NarL/FixJ family response regulator